MPQTGFSERGCDLDRCPPRRLLKRKPKDLDAQVADVIPQDEGSNLEKRSWGALEGS